MTRRPTDGDGEGEGGGEGAAEPPRRRRRVGGLRVPSDNVPRHSGSQPVVAPVPEDPSLAVSIAYAFGDDASGPRSRIEDESADDPTAIGARPEAPSMLPSLDDIIPDGRTRQMPALSLEALGLSSDDDLGMITHVGPPAAPPGPESTTGSVDVDMDDDGAPDHSGPALVTSPVPRSEPEPMAASGHDGASGDGLGRSSAAPPPLPGSLPSRPVSLSDDDLEEMVNLGPAPRPPRLRSPTQPMRSGTASSPPIDAGSHGERSAVPVATGPELPSVIVSFASTAMAPPVPPPPVPTLPPVPPMPPASLQPLASLPGPSLQPLATLSPVMIATLPTAPLTPIPPSTTMVTTPPPAPPAPPPVAAPATAASSGVFEQPVEAPHEDSLSDGWSLPVPDSHGEADVMSLGPADAVLEDAGEPVAAAADASDSGEILAEELVDDEEHARATPVLPIVAVVSGQQAAISPPPSPPPVRPPVPAVARPPAVPVVARQGHAQAQGHAQPPAQARAEAELDGDKKKRRGRPWFEEVFDEDYLRTLPYLTPAATQSEARMVLDALELNTGAQVLDLGCGYGRHAMELAARGLHVVGVDLSLPLLLRGADEAQRRGLDINFVHADMREIDFDAQFDGAYCLFSTFGYFDDDTNKKVATQIGKALKPGGRFVLQVLNRDYVIGDLPTRVWWEGDGCVVLEEVDFNYFSSRIQSKRSVVFDDGRQVEQEISIRAYSLHELGKLLHAAGLRVVEVSGGMTTRGRFLGNRAREIIVIADRPK